jgi:hypothetical protein
MSFGARKLPHAGIAATVAPPLVAASPAFEGVATIRVGAAFFVHKR